MKRGVADVGTNDSVEAALASSSGPVTLTNDELDLVLPSQGFDVLQPPASGPSVAPRAPLVSELENNPELQRQLSPEDVHAFFACNIAPPDAAFDRMRSMNLDELETLQGIADQISVGKASEESQKAAFEWSVRIGNFIA